MSVLICNGTKLEKAESNSGQKEPKGDGTQMLRLTQVLGKAPYASGKPSTRGYWDSNLCPMTIMCDTLA